MRTWPPGLEICILSVEFGGPLLTATSTAVRMADASVFKATTRPRPLKVIWVYALAGVLVVVTLAEPPSPLARDC